jgi:hypothetical protein
VNEVEDPGIYEIKIIDDDTIKFIPVEEDECFQRKNWLAGHEVKREEYM